jgi:anion-transporting  ArsA/GET3 family ATPase
VLSLLIETEPALGEWLARHVGAPAAALLRRSHAFGYFAAATPGAAELVTIGKAVDLARSGEYDCVIVDGPATGHALAMLAAPRTFAELAPVGPVAREAAELTRRLADRSFTAYVGVAAPEPMAVEELLELERRLPLTVGHGLDLIVVNAVHPDRFSDDDARRLQTAADRGPGRAVLEAVLVEHRRARREADQVRRLRALAGAQVAAVPFVFGVTVRRTPARGAPPAGPDPAVPAVAVPRPRATS